jgi:hexosaminidase
VKDYAFERGVEVIIEIDIPGHAAGWLKGKPEIMADCMVKYDYNINNWALNPALNQTYTTVNNILGDILKATGSKHIHVGGDEVVYGCWNNDSSVVSFYKSQGYTSWDQMLAYFVDKVDNSIVKSFDTSIIHWEEVFSAGCKVPAGTTFQVWTDSSMVSQLTSAKYPVIASPSNYWYLNIASNTWQNMYSYDPTVGLTSSQSQYIIGGETALWAEFIDETNIEVNLYPRACAVAERLWSPKTVIDQTDAQNRLIIQKCRMVNRGFSVTPVKPADYCHEIYV